MFASTSENFWSIWSIQPKDQIRDCLSHASSDREFHGCTGSLLKRPQSSPTGHKSILLSSRNPNVASKNNSPIILSPILKKTLVKVKSDSSLPSTPLLGSELRRAHPSRAKTYTSRLINCIKYLFPCNRLFKPDYSIN